MVLTTKEVEKVKANLVASNIESVMQFIEGFNVVMKQVKAIDGNINFDVVGPFKRPSMGRSLKLPTKVPRMPLFFVF